MTTTNSAACPLEVQPPVTLRPNIFEVDLSAIEENVATLQVLIGPGVKIFAALKANGYGFGVVEVAREVVAAGIDGLAMVDPADALAVRSAGVDAPILLYPGTIIGRDLVEIAQTHQLTLTVSDELSAVTAGSLASGQLRVFVKVDVGMERFGARPAEAIKLAALVYDHPRLTLAGVYTHMHAAEPAPTYFSWQIKQFERVVTELRARSVDVPLAMAASSPALSVLGGPSFDAVDAGHLIYGMKVPLPSAHAVSLRRAFSAVKSQIVHCKYVNRTAFPDQAPFPLRPGMRIAVLPIGRADGLKSFTSGEVLVRGRRASILGNLSLEHCRIDVTEIPEANIGDEAVIVGKQNNQSVTVEEVCSATGLDEVGVATSIGRSIRRVYVRRN